MNLKIYGFNKSSEAGGDAFCPSVFVNSCNMRCPYCMNCRLVTGNPEAIEIEPVEQFIKENHPSMVMISGGEPTFNIYTQEIVAWLKGLGCRVGVSTNGLSPDNLKELVVDYAINYVALDLKGLPAFYRSYISCGSPDSFFSVIESWNLLRHSYAWGDVGEDFNYELRTTLYPNIYAAIMFFGPMFIEGEKWLLQPFRKTNEIMSEEASIIKPYPAHELNALLEAAKGCSKATVEMRNV